MRRLLSSLAFAASFLTPFACAEDSQEADKDSLAEIQQMLKQRPDDPNLHYFLAMLQAEAREPANAVASLKKVAELGIGFYPVEDFGFDSLVSDKEYLTVRAGFDKQLPRIAGAPVAFRLADIRFIPEGIAYDPVARHFYIGSAAGRGIVRVSLSGRETPFSRKDDGLQQVLGLAVDPKGRTLYAVNNSEPDKDGKRQCYVVRYDLASGKLVARYPAPGAGMLNDLAIGPRGDLYVSDTVGGAVWHLPADAVSGATLERLLPAGSVHQANGIVVSSDGALLYLAHLTGIARIDVAGARLEQLAVPARETVAAIDGLYLHQGALFGVQNVTNPGRILRMPLKDDRTISAIETLQSHHNPAFVQPTTAAIANDALYVLGTTQIAFFRDGKYRNESKLVQPAVVKIRLSGPK